MIKARAGDKLQRLGWMVDRQIRGAASAGRNQHRQTVSGTVLRGLPGGSALIPPHTTSASLPTLLQLKEKMDLRTETIGITDVDIMFSNAACKKCSF